MQTYADVCWRMLTYVFWRMLTFADVCRRILTYADVRRRMLTYADVCSHMPTSADVCWRMQLFFGIMVVSHWGGCLFWYVYVSVLSIFWYVYVSVCFYLLARECVSVFLSFGICMCKFFLSFGTCMCQCVSIFWYVYVSVCLYTLLFYFKYGVSIANIFAFLCFLRDIRSWNL